MIMPGMNGRELASRLLELRPSLKVLYTSGYAADSTGKGFLDDTMAFLPKPFTSLELSLKIRQVLDGRDGHRPREKSS
jgi:CheY-like chemotaxis protein